MSFIILRWKFISSKYSMGVDATRISEEISTSTFSLTLTFVICYLVRCRTCFDGCHLGHTTLRKTKTPYIEEDSTIFFPTTDIPPSLLGSFPYLIVSIGI
jgi:hypothetical protein